MMKQTLLALGVITLVAGLSGCGGTETKTTVNATQTQGQQLMDLKEAYDKGVITEKEYNRTKEDILDQ